MAAPRFENEDEAAQYYLSSLRDGTRAEKIEARDGLAAIFSRRGLYEEAAELYELNIRAGVRTPDLFVRLSEVYRRLGDHDSAAAALEEARRQRGSAAGAPASPASGSPAPAPDPAPPHRPTVPAPAEPRLLQFPGAAAADGRPPTRPTEPAPIPASSGARFARPAASARGSAAPALSPDPSLDALPAMAPPTMPQGLAEQAPDAPATMMAPWADAETAKLPRSSRSGSVPGPVLVMSIVLFMIVLPVLLLAVLVVNPIALYLEGRDAGPTVDVHAGEPPSLKVAAGATSAWYLQTGRSVSGLWASPGLDLTLDQPLAGVGPTFAVTGARPQAWGETITIVERRGQGRANQTTVVPARFEAPRSLPPTGTVLAGHVVGQVTAPRLSESSQFNTTTEDVNLPVRLVVVSGPELWLDRFANALGMYADEDRWLLVTIGALLAWCVLAGGAAIVFRVGQR